ncbi:ABC transporter ATP-binding protein [Cellulomonas sp. P24]|uniref:ABC transporter ATP-binding protein n=1 Tax=Cellulomonas sp. P24 TaxID=2885206 RepID=UPI00216B2364|nr:ABC transporter ATP-binding protein [Cellulomonas sp. P24]MCR6492188.1 ABC transporter ATP-binding protein [Cellulomonas sp. P24]
MTTTLIDDAARLRTTPAVRLHQVGKRFSAHGTAAVDRVDLTIAPGEFVCLVGASGCGKTTLLHLVAGIETPTSGTVEVAGAGVGTGAAVMFQDAALYPWLSARGNVELALRLGGVARRERRARAEDLLRLVHLGERGESAVHELSGGMRQRVALARALAQDREVLLMDEPFAALDAITRDLLHDELERVWRATGRTVVLITHDVREAVRLGQRVLLMAGRPGRVVHEWQVEDRREPVAAAALAATITDRLREEMHRDAR